jgi:hypothetical protein
MAQNEVKIIKNALELIFSPLKNSNCVYVFNIHFLICKDRQAYSIMSIHMSAPF